MKVTRNALATSAVILTVAGGSVATAMAATPSSSTTPSLASEIAQRFNIDQSQVQSVIDQHRTEIQQNREAKYEQRLDTAVSQGKLTAAQKQLVLDEHNKLVAEVKATNKDDRRQTMKAVHQEAKAWSTQNKIDLKWLMPVRDVTRSQQSD